MSAATQSGLILILSDSQKVLPICLHNSLIVESAHFVPDINYFMFHNVTFMSDVR